MLANLGLVNSQSALAEMFCFLDFGDVLDILPSMAPSDFSVPCDCEASSTSAILVVMGVDVLPAIWKPYIIKVPFDSNLYQYLEFEGTLGYSIISGILQ